ncbi:MAG TPA: hypothetical protein VF120_14550, partial [Ktedonobacterales bacterium]
IEVARRHLIRDGWLLLDLDLKSVNILRKLPGRVWWQGTWPLPDGGEVSHFMAARQDEQPRVLRLQHFYDLIDHTGNLRRVTASMRLAALRRGHVERSLVHAGFVIDALYGSHDLAPYEEGAPRAIFVARPAYEASSGPARHGS